MTINNNDLNVENRNFLVNSEGLKYTIPYILTPSVEIEENQDIPTLKPDSQTQIAQYHAKLKESDFNMGGAAIIFGTYDNLHAGHEVMLKTARAICDTLYIGVENQNAALARKKNKHAIMSNDERLSLVRDFAVTNPANVFIRDRALVDIINLEESGIAFNTLIVGESQQDNPEIIEAVEYCMSKCIQVVATTRLRVSNLDREISSSAIHRSGATKNGNKYTPQ